MTRLFFVLILILSVCLTYPLATSAATFVVDTEVDSPDLNPGDGIAADNEDPLLARVSFRAALEESNALFGPDTILMTEATTQFDFELGTLWLTDNSTIIRGTAGFPILDGAYLPYGATLMEISSDSNIITGLTFRRSRSHGLVITGRDNIIGGTTNETRNQFLGCGLDYQEAAALVITGSNASGNKIRANWIGLTGNGTVTYGNQNGILITDSASNNEVGYELFDASCFVSGSDGWGITISNSAHDNRVQSTLVGLDLTFLAGAGNQAGGILLDNCRGNLIGGELATARNQICGNEGWGVVISGSNAYENEIHGNFIGIENTGLISIANHGGLLITGQAHHNTVGGEDGLPANVISGNAGDGVRIEGSGTEHNRVLGNFIGPSSRGGGLYAGDTYSQNGVMIADGARYNEIGSPAPAGGNVISLNEFAGVLITGSGSMENALVGNFIGLTLSGASSAPNGSGVVIRDGASHNLIGGYTEADRNLISGNRSEVFPWGGGVVLYDPGTSYNTIVGNYIGTDYNGTRALRNGSSGVLMGNGASHNSIGGSVAGAGNLISGNGVDHEPLPLARGVTIMGDGTAYNRVEGNLIGPKADLSGYLDNWGHGVGIFDGASDNRIGGDKSLAGNLIAGNDGYGILAEGSRTDHNLFRNNLISHNHSGAIKLGTDANHSLPSPIIFSANEAYLDGQAHDSGLTIDVYRYWSDPLNGDLSSNRVGSGLSQADHSFLIAVTDLNSGDSVWAIITSSDSSSSAYSNIIAVEVATAVAEPDELLPLTFSLGQNFPNPFNPSTTISFSLPQAGPTTLTIYNIAGQTVTQPLHQFVPAGEHFISWDGCDDDGHDVASGIYFYRLRSGPWDASRTAILLR